MPSQTQRYVIAADSTQAELANARVNVGIAQMGSTAQASTNQAGSAYEAMARRMASSTKSAESSAQSYGRRLAELGAVGVAAYAAMGAEAIRYSARAAEAAAATDSLTSRLANLYRATRLVLSPTIGTVAGLAVAYGAERTLEYAYKRGGEINAQAFTAAKTDNTLGGIEQLQNLARLRGAQQDAFIAASQDLKKQLSTDRGATALQGLGLTDTKDSVESLKEIANAFAGVSDPVEKARLAIELFGPSAAKILPELNQSFADSADRIQKWGLEIGDDRAREITQFKADVDELRHALGLVGDAAGISRLKISNFFAGVGARVGNVLFAGGDILANDKANAFHAQFSDVENSDAFRLGVDPSIIRDLRKPLDGVRAASPYPLFGDHSREGYDLRQDVQKVVAGADVGTKLAEAQQRLTQAASTLSAGTIFDPGQLDEKTHRLDPKSIRIRPLSTAETFALGNEFTTAQRQVAQFTSEKKAADDAERAKSEGEAAALESKRHSSELERTLGQLARKTGDVGPFGSLFNEIQHARSFVDKSGQVRSQDLNPTEQIQAARAYHNVVAELQKKSSTEDLRLIEEQSSTRLRYEDELYQKRREKELEIGEVKRDTLAKQFELQRGDLESSKESALNSLALRDANPLERIAGNLDISSRYANESAILDIEKIQREQLAKLSKAGTDPEFRSEIIKNSGVDAVAVQRKNTSDLLHAQEQAQVESANLIKEANLRSFGSLKEQALGVLDSIESKSQNVFQAMGSALKKTILGAINDIVSSQIAAGLFGLFNPGSQVKGFEPENGIKRGGFGGALQRLGLGAGPEFSGGLGGLVPAFAGGAPAGNVGFSQGSQSVVPAQGFIGAGDSTAAGVESINSGPQASNGGGTIGGRFGISPSLLAQLAVAAPAIAGQESYGSDSFKQIPDIAPTASYAAGGSILAGAAALSSIPNYGGGPAGTSPIAGATGGVKGLFGKLTGKGGFGSLKDAIYNSGSIDLAPGISTTAAGISANVAGKLGGGAFGHAIGSVVGGVAGFAASDAGAAVGGSLVLGGLSAKHSSVLSDASTTAGGALLGANIGSKIPGLGEGPGAVAGGGIGLAAAGLKRGGAGGLLETTAGGAIAGAGIGFAVGGPIGALFGAAIGAGVGAVAGFVRLFVKGARQQIKDLVKSLYRLSISDQMADQIEQIAKQNFGGSFSIAVRSPQVLDLLNLYAQVTGQPFLIKNKPYAAYLTETTGGLKQAAQYVQGAPISYASQAGVGVLNNQATTVLSDFSVSQSTARNHGNATDYNLTTPAVQQITVQLDGNSSAAFLQGQTVAAIGSNPTEVAKANGNAYSQNYGRTNTAAQLLSPNLLYI